MWFRLTVPSGRNTDNCEKTDFSHERTARLETSKSSQSGRGRKGRRGYPALPILSEKQGHVFAIVAHLPQKLLQGNKREREAQIFRKCLVMPQHQTTMARHGAAAAAGSQRSQLPACQPSAMKCLFPVDGRRFHYSRRQISLRQGIGKKPLGQTRGRVKLHTQKRSHGSLSCAS